MIFENINCVGGSHVIKLEAKPEPLDYLVFEQKTYISDIVISNVYAEACRQQSICLRCSSRIFNTVTDEKSATQAEFIASKENDGFDIYHISLSNVL